MDDLEKKIEFIRRAEGLKSVVREAWTSTGRRESTAEHSWRLALLAGVIGSSASASADTEKILKMCLIHDLGELYIGDISAVSKPDEDEKHRMEERDVRRVLSCLPKKQEEELLALWQEYNENMTVEARIVKALDKAETILQHNQGQNPPDFDYEFNLEYGKPYFEGDLLLQLRHLLDEETAARIRETTALPKETFRIRKAVKEDASRLAEILIFAKRTAYRAIFQNDVVSFNEMRVLDLALHYRDTKGALEDVWVCTDCDGIVKGMMSWDRSQSDSGLWELKELYTDPFFKCQGAGGALMKNFLISAEESGVDGVFLWVLEKNGNARDFYEKYGFLPTGEKKLQEGTEEYLLKYRKNM